MPEDWSKLRDVDPLADGRACMDLEVPLADFPRLTSQLAETTGRARARVCFGRAAGGPVAEITVAAEPRLICQRCLTPVSWPVSGSETVALVRNADEADRAPATFETVLAEDGRVSLRDLVEEELLVRLPLVARHEEGCAPQVAEEPAAPEEERQRPFADLQQLLRSRDK